MISNDIWVFVEYRDNEVSNVTLEMLSEARKLVNQRKGKTCACLIGRTVREYLPLLRDYGAEKVYLLENNVFSEYSLDIYAAGLQKLIVKYAPLLMMFGGTAMGSELGPRIAARLKLPCMTEVKRIWVAGDNLIIAKSCYDDKVYQHFDFRPETTVILTLLPGDMDSERSKPSGEMEIIEEDISCGQEMIRTRYKKFLKGDPRRISIEEADLIIAGGKGIGNDLHVLEDLADTLGASVGGTRPLVDNGIIPFERQIGITGKSVSPRLLITCGISGAREFTAGIQKARLTIAINTDAKASILKFANLGVIGDLHKIVPRIIAYVKTHKENMKKGESL